MTDALLVPVAHRRLERPWWKVVPTDRRGVAHLIGAYVVLTAVYCAIGAAIMRWWGGSTLGDLDVRVNRWLADHRTDLLTELAHFGSALSNTETKIVLVLGLLPLMLHLYRRWHDWSLIALGLLLEVSVFATSATLINRPRPPVERLDGAPTHSWPSGHIAASVVFYVGVATVIRWNNSSRPARVVSAVIAIGAPGIVVMSRLYLGMHHPSDAIGGIALGLVSLAIVTRALRRTAGESLDHPALLASGPSDSLDVRREDVSRVPDRGTPRLTPAP